MELFRWFVGVAIGIVVVGFLSAFIPEIQWIVIPGAVCIGMVIWIRYEQEQRRLDDEAQFGSLERENRQW